jgi:predicted Zn-dependent peptidase
MQVKGQAYLASDSIQTRVSRLATQQFYFGRPLDADTLLEAIDQVNKDSVCKIARRVIGAGLSATGIGIAGKIPGTTEGLANEISDLRGCFGSAGLEIS